jgi:hypothetical protein
MVGFPARRDDMKHKLWFFLLVLIFLTGCTSALEAWVDESLQLDEFQAKDSFILHFNQPMDPESIENPLIFVPGVSGKYNWNWTRTILTFSPETKFIPGKYYTVYIRIR